MKQFSSRLSMAVHMLWLIAVSPAPLTSDYIAGSVNTNPVIIRKLMGKLKKAGLVEVRPGVGGASLLKSCEHITLLDIYRAVEVSDDGELFNFHDHPNLKCPVGGSVGAVLGAELLEAQQALENKLGQVSLARLIVRGREQSPSEIDG